MTLVHQEFLEFLDSLFIRGMQEKHNSQIQHKGVCNLYTKGCLGGEVFL